MEHLKCPLCKDRTTTPVTFCEKGHNVYCTCRGSLDERATGSHQFSGIRNIKLEKISFWSNFSCPYLECGCKVTVPVELIFQHLKLAFGIHGVTQKIRADAPSGRHSAPHGHFWKILHLLHRHFGIVCRPVTAIMSIDEIVDMGKRPRRSR